MHSILGLLVLVSFAGATEDQASVAGFETSYTYVQASEQRSYPSCDFARFGNDEKSLDLENKRSCKYKNQLVEQSMRECANRQARVADQVMRSKDMEDLRRGLLGCQFDGINADRGYQVSIEVVDFRKIDGPTSSEGRGVGFNPLSNGNLRITAAFVGKECKTYDEAELKTILREAFAPMKSKAKGPKQGCHTLILNNGKTLPEGKGAGVREGG